MIKLWCFQSCMNNFGTVTQQPGNTKAESEKKTNFEVLGKKFSSAMEPTWPI